MSWRTVVAALWRTNMAEELQYRGNFAASLLGTLFWVGMAVLTVAVFFRQTDALGGWSFWEVVVLLGVFNALAGVVEAVLRPSIGRLVEDVRTGALDLVLVRPVETQLYVSLRRLDIWRLSDVVIGLALVAFAMARLDREPEPATVVAFALTFVAAVAVLYAIWISLMSTAFWFVAVENLSVLFDAIYQAARYPASAYPGALRFLFVYLVPIAWTTTIPASALVGRLKPLTGALALAVAVVALVLSRRLWLVAVRRYTSAGG